MNDHIETAATSRMFKPLWQHGRAICFADSWFEWKKEGDNNMHKVLKEIWESAEE
ncbi:hypothetical protein MRY16398_26620 [Phytobacter sp. MRY16-398]|nr:hypothetical protein MRY16398_26620 [Phytobacter sp. MRY16-398]